MLYIQGDAADPVVGQRVCSEDDGIVELSLHLVGENIEFEKRFLLWRVEAGHGQPSREIRLGVTPDGYTTPHPLTVPLDATTTYELRADFAWGGYGYLTFRPEQLAAGNVVFGSEQTESRQEYDDRDGQDFGCCVDD
ncbi:hypothetical protein [Streptomyces hainanensis]|uniref:Uncharacterized protein n=1 Tax=Streptomyces hainanensis TaxID=402648 RepID=A0A4R4TJC4_9ACTN|nr:hypothetical protein [Streptomyces hainanensis]TDC74259.1 hypothetical protein E1283_16325 [Streptomyces hainanensis]